MDDLLNKQVKEADDMDPALSTAACNDARLESTGEEDDTETGDIPPLDSLERLPAGTCYEYGPMSACKTQRCVYKKA